MRPVAMLTNLPYHILWF